MPTRARTRHEVGKARRRWNSTRYQRARAAGVSCGLRGLPVIGFGMVAAVPELGGAHLGDRDQVLLGFVRGGQRDGQVGLREG